MQTVFDAAFAPYGKVVQGYDFTELLDALRAGSERPADAVIYVPGDAALEALPVARQIEQNLYGGLPIQIGYCNGHNKKLNCLEYHRGSEVNIAADDVVLLLAQATDIVDGKLDTAAVQSFLLPAGTGVLLYETALHYAPCTAKGGEGFRVIIVLPRGTNREKPEITPKNDEDALLWAANKWLLAHPDTAEAAAGAYIGLTGENITVE